MSRSQSERRRSRGAKHGNMLLLAFVFTGVSGALSCGDPPPGNMCTALLDVRLAATSTLEAGDLATVRILRGQSTAFEGVVDLGGAIGVDPVLVTQASTGEVPLIAAGDEFRVEVAIHGPVADQPAREVGRTEIFECRGNDRNILPAYVGPANGFADVDVTAGVRLGGTASSTGDGTVVFLGGEAANDTVLAHQSGSYDHLTGELCVGCIDGAMPARVGHTATALADGRVVVVGGVDPAQPTQVHADVWIFDPISGLSELTLSGDPLIATREHVAVLLDNDNVGPRIRGRILLAGGRRGDDELNGGAYLLDPESGSVKRVTDLADARYQAAAVLLSSGQVLITGGRGPIGVPFGNAEIMNTETDVVNQLGFADLPRPCTAITTLASDTLCARRAGHTAIAMDDGNILLWGGQVLPLISEPDLSPTAEVIQLGLLQAMPVNEDVPMGEPTMGHTVSRVRCAVGPCPILIVGGKTTISSTPGELHLFGVATATHLDTTYVPGFFRHQTLPADMQRTRHSSAVLEDGSVLFVGGEDASTGVPITSAKVFSYCGVGDDCPNVAD